jgi:tetratricopeptide (TPR) repeat protein
MSSSQLRYLFIALSILLAAGLFFAPSQINSKPKTASVEKREAKEISEEQLIASAKESLKDEQKGFISALEMQLNADSSKLSLYDSLGNAWDEAKIPAASAYYFALKAKRNPTEDNYLKAAYRYFDAFKLADDSLLRNQLAQKAISNYSSVLEINPGNLNAKTDLGVCYAEGTGEPMKGIMLLREVVKENPDHEMAQLNLGFLSVKSGQYAKAIERFNTVMKINPKRTDVYYFLGRTYYEAGKQDSALLWLNKLKEKSEDYQLVQQAQVLINQMQSN